jgi:hypothetical protein
MPLHSAQLNAPAFASARGSKNCLRAAPALTLSQSAYACGSWCECGCRQSVVKVEKHKTIRHDDCAGVK